MTQESKVRRIGMVIGMRSDRITAYEAVHAASHLGVRDLLNRYHMHNFSIFLHQLDNGQYYLFGYYEYTGDDYKADMAKLAAEPRNQEWLSNTDAMQIPLPGEESWSVMREVFFNA
jgi:L-rhamnose mutarotase